MNLYAFFRKYVWDEDKTPYLVPVPRLTPVQARNEIFAFAVLLAAFAMMITGAAIFGRVFETVALGAAIYASSVFSAAIVLVTARHPAAAAYCAAAPLAPLLYFIVAGFPPNLHMVDELLVIALLLGLVRYGMRVVAIARTHRHTAKGG